MKRKNIKLTLFDRTKEIYEELPTEYRDIIFNNILSKSINNNILADELSLYLTKENIEDILNNLSISFKTAGTQRKKITNNKTYIKKELKKEEKKEKENEDLFSY